MAVDRRRRNQETKKENHERWVISYADFMTLLLATFVVLYAVSSINVSRYRAAAQALAAVFTGRVAVENRGEGGQPSGMFEHNPAPVALPVTRPAIMPRPLNPVHGTVDKKVEERQRKLDKAYQNLTHLLKDVISKGEVHIVHNGSGVVINIKASVLFHSGSADLTTKALGVIDQIGVVLEDLPYNIQVNGYTDDVPIHTTLFDSNWELSAIRAMSVVRRFVDDGIEPSHLVGAGYGQYHPIASNDTPGGMAKNRRVSIVVLSGAPATKSGNPSQAKGAASTNQPAMPSQQPQDAAASPPATTSAGLTVSEPTWQSAPTGSAPHTAPATTPNAAQPAAATATPMTEPHATTPIRRAAPVGPIVLPRPIVLPNPFSIAQPVGPGASAVPAKVP